MGSGVRIAKRPGCLELKEPGKMTSRKQKVRGHRTDHIVKKKTTDPDGVTYSKTPHQQTKTYY